MYKKYKRKEGKEWRERGRKEERGATEKERRKGGMSSNLCFKKPSQMMLVHAKV
jgi:hypothetical protein